MLPHTFVDFFSIFVPPGVLLLEMMVVCFFSGRGIGYSMRFLIIFPKDLGALLSKTAFIVKLETSQAFFLKQEAFSKGSSLYY